MAAWSGLYNHIHGVNYSPLGSRTNLQRKFSRLLEKRGSRVTAKLLQTLDGVAPGSAASYTYPRISNPDSSEIDKYPYSGKRTLETVTLINRNTTSADVTALNQLLDDKFAPAIANYPLPKDGRKPGGMVGAF